MNKIIAKIYYWLAFSYLLIYMSGGSDFYSIRKMNHNLGTGHGNLCINESVVKNWINRYLPDFE